MKKLTTFQLLLVIIASVDSIRNVPAIALFGASLPIYFLLAVLGFLLPAAIVVSWFGSNNPLGIYGWVKQGLGKHWGLTAIWLQCLQNLFCFPTFLSFIAATMLYAINPDFIENRWLLFGVINVLFWGLTLVNLFDLKHSLRLNKICVTVGLMLPFVFIIVYGIYCSLMNPSIHKESYLFHQSGSHAITAIILSFCGIEVVSVYRSRSDPAQFHRACLWSVPFIALTMFLAAYGLQHIIPANELSLIAGVPQTLDLVASKMGFASLSPIANLLIAFGCLAAASNWIIVPAKGLQFAIADAIPSSRFAQTNHNASPALLLICQGILVTLITCLYLFIHSINQSYWLLLSLTTVMYLIMYLVIFCSALRLARKHVGQRLIKIAVRIGLLGILFSLVNALAPPTDMSRLTFDGLLALCALLSLLPLFILQSKMAHQ